MSAAARQGESVQAGDLPLGLTLEEIVTLAEESDEDIHDLFYSLRPYDEDNACVLCHENEAVEFLDETYHALRGRRPVLLLSLVVLGIDYVIMWWAPTFAWLLIGRVIAGAAASTFSTCGAYIADISEPDKRAQNFGLIGAAFGMGFVLGPVIGGFIGEYGARLGVPGWGFAVPPEAQAAAELEIQPRHVAQVAVAGLRAGIDPQRGGCSGAVSSGPGVG